MKESTGQIRQATDADIEAIHRWLIAEDARGVENFLCNWPIIKEYQQEGRVIVYIDGASGEPVAFQTGGLLCPGILEVRKDMRRRGIGRKLVKYCIEEALRNDECNLFIECTPESSIPFWEAMGFTRFGEPHRRHAYRILGKKHQLPAGGQQIEANIRFYPEGRLWNGGESVAPYNSPEPVAMLMPDDVIRLSERVSCFTNLHPDGDPVLEIVVNGQRLYRDKAKRPESKRVGVQRCSHGFFIDAVQLREIAKSVA